MKKLFALFLAFTLFAGMFGGIQAAAATYPYAIDPTQPYVDLSKLTVKTGTANTDYWYYDHDSSTLNIYQSGVTIYQSNPSSFDGCIETSNTVTSVTLDSINVTPQNATSALLVGNNNFTITLLGKSELKAGGSQYPGLNAGGLALTIDGGGTLVCYGGDNSSGSGAYGVEVGSGSINVVNGRIEAHGGKSEIKGKDGAAFFIYEPQSDKVDELQAVLRENGQPANEKHLLDINSSPQIFNTYKMADDYLSKHGATATDIKSQPYAYLEYFPPRSDDRSTTRKREPTILPISLKRNFDETTLAAGKKYDFTIMGPDKDTASYVYVTGGTIASRSGHNFTVVPNGTAKVVKITITADGFKEITLEYDVTGGVAAPLPEPEAEEESFNPSTGV